ncbi:winged helix-turn-helix domain-containing protein [Candidatus Woesearchaeota archaeon]|nr:winged helix-turn-helix domain-containing protein [Candidatus Woesearchaeota archaeon]
MTNGKERAFDKQEATILKELIRNPRISDNQLGRKTGIPVKTVNRKRKRIEQEGLINYYAHIDHGPSGTGKFMSSYLYLASLKHGLTRKQVHEALLAKTQQVSSTFRKHLHFTSVGEMDGRVCLVAMLESYKDEDVLEIYNADIVPFLNSLFGPDAIHSTRTVKIAHRLSLLNNYAPQINMQGGRIRQDWPDDYIFV